jgi:hypothetical protein
MAKFRWLPVVLVVCFVLSATATAQDIPAQKPMVIIADTFQFLPGTWADYTIADKEKNETFRFYFAVLTKKMVKGKSYWWIEIEDNEGRKMAAAVSLELPPIALYSCEDENIRMTINDWGSGAKSKIEGTTIPFFLWEHSTYPIKSSDNMTKSLPITTTSFHKIRISESMIVSTMPMLSITAAA